MEFKIITHDAAQKTATVLAWVITLMAFVFIISWHVAGGAFAFKVPIKGFVLSYYASIAIFFSGLCFLNLIYVPRFYIYKVIAAVFLILSIMRVMGIVINDDFGLHDFLKTHLFSTINDLPNILIGGAVVVFVNALVYLIWPLKHRTRIKSTLITCLLAVIFLISFEGLVIYFLPVNPTDVAVNAPIHPIFGIMQLLLAIGLLARNSYEDAQAKVKPIKWLSLFFGLGVLLFHFFLMTGFLQEQRLTQAQLLKEQAYAIKSEIKATVVNLGDSLHRFAGRMASYQSITTNLIDLDINNYLIDISYLENVAVINKNFLITKEHSKDGFNSLLDIKSHLGQQLQELSAKKNISSYLNRGEKKLVLASPVVWDQVFQGAALFQLDLVALIKTCAFIQENPGYAFEILCNQLPLYQSSNFQDKNGDQVFFTESFDLYDLTFQVQIASTSELLVNKIIKSLILFLTMGGILGSIITGAVIFLFQSLREKIRLTQTVTKQLLMSNEIMHVMNEAESVQNACDLILKIMNEHYGWLLFIYWQYNDKNHSLELVHVTSIPEGAFSQFEKATKKLEDKSYTLFNQAFEKKEVLFSEDISHSNYTNAKAALNDGIKGAFALPVFHKRDVLGVFELYKKEPLIIEPESGWIELMKIIGNQFSVFIERREAHLIDKELTAVISNSSDAIYKADLDLIIRTWNLGAEHIYGYLAEEIIGQKVDILYPQDRFFEKRNIQETLLRSKSIEHFKTVRKRKDGQLIWVENSYSPILNEKGQVISFSVVSRDITKEKQALDALELNEEKFRQFVDSTQSWIWEMDKDGNFTYSNPAVTKILGYSLDEILKTSWRSLVLEKQKLEKELSEYVKKPEGWKQKLFQVLSKNGSLVWLEVSAEPIKNQHHDFIGFRGVCRDVTDEININISKNEFISMVSHELRTPLTSIMGALGLLKSKVSKEDESLELVTLADRNADRLLKLINDILDVEKLSLGKIELNFKNYEFAKIIQDALNTANTQAQEQQVILKGDKIHKGIYVNVDYDRLVQVILNLVSNALKFSPKQSSVLVFTELKDTIIRLNIQDKGPGIAYDMQGKLFDKFVQGQTGDTKLKGTGLGLSISKALMEQMGGSIGFVSQPSFGSTFYIDLPIAKGSILT